MTVTHKLFKILSGHYVANGWTDRQTDGRTDEQTDERHTIIRPKFYFGRIKILMRNFRHILPSFLFGQPCLFGQYGNDVIGEPAHVLIPSSFTPQYFKSQQIKENPKE